MSHLTLLLLTLAAFAAAGGQLCLRIGARGRVQWIEFINLPILFGLSLYAVGVALWIYTLSYEKLVNVYAFTALTFALVYLGGVALLGETLSYSAVLGVLLMLVGLYLITGYNS